MTGFDVCRKSVDSVNFVRLAYWNSGQWNMYSEVMDFVPGFFPALYLEYDFINK